MAVWTFSLSAVYLPQHSGFVRTANRVSGTVTKVDGSPVTVMQSGSVVPRVTTDDDGSVAFTVDRADLTGAPEVVVDFGFGALHVKADEYGEYLASVAATGTSDTAVAAIVGDTTSSTRGTLDTTYASASTDQMRYDSTDLRAFKAALGKRATTPVDVLCIGDSITEGQGGTALTNRWQDRLRDRLRKDFQPSGVTGGEGYIPSIYYTSGYAQRVTYTGTTSASFSFGLGKRTNTLTGSGATATVTFTGTGVDILWAGGPSTGKFTYAVDGGAASSPVDTLTATVTGSKVTQVRGLTAGSHTIVVTKTADAGSVYLEGFMIYNGDASLGIRVWDSGHYGYRTADFLDNANHWWQGAFTTVQPDLVSIELGVNDYGTSTTGNRLTPAQTRANIETIIADIRARCTVPPSIVLWLPYQRSTPTGTPLAPWSDYLEALRALAEADGKVTLFDAMKVLGDLSAGNTYGLANGDLIHPSDAGHQALADALYRLVTSN